MKSYGLLMQMINYVWPNKILAFKIKKYNETYSIQFNWPLEEQKRDFPWTYSGYWYISLAKFMGVPNEQCSYCKLYEHSQNVEKRDVCSLAISYNDRDRIVRSISNYYSPVLGPSPPKSSKHWLAFFEGLAISIPLFRKIELDLLTKFYVTRYRDWETDRKSTRLNSSHLKLSRMPSSA